MGGSSINVTKDNLAVCPVASEGLLKHGRKEASVCLEHSFIPELVEDEVDPMILRAGAGLELHSGNRVLDGAADLPGRRVTRVRVEVG